ncbi:MAG: type III-B CRISPR module RAMP protein Cmr4 [Prosthecochloris sp.]|uniref:type III-B CRISPR module RAMP protein Cmr4 n=1 Tax=Prosthecochloris sp. TaxID=290513 RepID=UPI0013CD2897|nr:type III-B CRISPR module RAMP protein Cmr4 [Prosthecochloris sp.]NEX11099.1 type III-B CRISPR module RAMP protein Cmr4 [Prosthecochloris sp.]
MRNFHSLLSTGFHRRFPNVPKIPGSSLHGAARSYAASIYNKPSCAGQGKQKRNGEQTSKQSGHCGQDTCQVCYTFGYSKNTGEHSAYSGTVNVFDAHIILFPVHSLEGPVWITTTSRIIRLISTTHNFADPEHEETVTPLFELKENFLTLGWLVLNAGPNKTVDNLPSALPEQIRKHIVLVHENLFSHIVNSNLEIRTSVAIDPERGAAEDGALFTYEAIPRTTILAADAVIDDYRKMFLLDNQPKNKTENSENDSVNPQEVLEKSLHLISWLGIGGMGTRGFGRMEILDTTEKTNE